MRDLLFGLVVAVLSLAGGAVMTALSVIYGQDAGFIHWLLYAGVILMALGAANFVLLCVFYCSDENLRKVRPRTGPAALVNLSVCLAVAPAIWPSFFNAKDALSLSICLFVIAPIWYFSKDKEAATDAKHWTAKPGHLHDWKSAPDAVEAFAEPTLRATRDRWSQKFDEAHESKERAEDAIRGIRKTFANGSVPENAPEARLIDNNLRQLEVSARQSDIATEELRRAWDALRSDIHKKLCSGKLISRGFRVPHVSGNSEVNISSEEWRVLTLDNAQSEAIRDGELLYTGLLIGNESEP